MYFDPASVYEGEIEPWSVREPITHEPNAERILDFITEWVSDNEVDADCFDAWSAAARLPDVLAAAETLRAALASHVSYRMADQHLTDHVVTWDEDGDPLYDGKPMYHLTDDQQDAARASAITGNSEDFSYLDVGADQEVEHE